MFDDRSSQGRRVGRAALLVLVLAGVGGTLIAGSAFFPTLVEAKKTALRTEVHPGELDDYYGFFSGGHSGEVRVIGLPSMRLLKRVPVFNVDSGSGWGITNESKAMLGGLVVGDTHHAHASYKDGTYDGQYLWINDKANNRLARIRLDLMETESIISIPHSQGTHGIFPQRYPQTDWVIINSEFRSPLNNDGKGDMRDAAGYGGVHTVVDAHDMKIICQVMVPCNLDLAATDYQGHYSFATSYNSEGGATISEMLAKDRDWLVVFNWDAIKEGLKKKDYQVVDGIQMLDGKPGSPYALYIPVPKNPHGVNVSPDGKYAVCSGKVSPTATVVAIDKLADAFAGKIQPKDTIVAEPEIGLGPLHTTFDGRGNAYTSLFIDSQIVKWNIQKAIDLYRHPKEGDTAVVDRLDIHYQVGHTMASMAETKEADGNFLVSLNKISKDRFLNVGPLKPENDQLVDISGDKMRLLEDEPSYIEPHDCIIVRRDIVEPHVRDRVDMDEHPLAVHKNAIERSGNKVTVHLTANAPVYGMQAIEVDEGDEVTFIVTNHDEIPDLSHGFCISNYGINFVVGPFQTRSVTFVADKPGLHWIYCTNFCHALHLEMRLRLLVKAKA
ncbi:MAG TPA: TAT-dependent nitrous-oxide reductase [bacterium]